MRHELKALALIALLAVGAAQPAAAMAYRFEASFGYGVGYPYGSPCDALCYARFLEDTGGGGPATGTLVVNSAGIGMFSMTIGDWSETFNSGMVFLDPWPQGPDTVLRIPLSSSWGQGGFFLCGPAVSPPNSVHGVANQASDFISCSPYLGSSGGPDGYLSSTRWGITMVTGQFRYVPEPGTLMLLSLGLLGLGFTAQRRLH